MAEMQETAGAVETTETEAPKMYTQEEVDKLIQSESDKRVTQALKKQESKNSERVREAEKLARMNESEKFQYELEQREQAIKVKERELSLMENKNAASKILSEKGISLNLVDFVIDEDAEIMDSRIKLLEGEFKKCVRAEVERRLTSKAPKASIGGAEGMTKEQFNKLSLSELQRLKAESPEVYESFTRNK